MYYWTWCRGQYFQSLRSSGFCPSLLASCSARHVEWTHKIRHQGTARYKSDQFSFSFFLLLKSKFTFLFGRREVSYYVAPHGQTPLSCLNFLNVRVTDMCHCSQLTFHLSYFCATIFFPFQSKSMAIFIIDSVPRHSCSMKSFFFTFYGFALCFVVPELSGPQNTNFYTCIETHHTQH